MDETSFLIQTVSISENIYSGKTDEIVSKNVRHLKHLFLTFLKNPVLMKKNIDKNTIFYS
nr:MAG TPA: hypothetical protein [Caudoviricetes sp.]DAQ99393.1 MAG TPA: hypothetical protein [Caudoviricetes sp.]